MKKMVFKDQGFAHVFSIYALADLDSGDCALFIYNLYNRPRLNLYYERNNPTYLIKLGLPGTYKRALMFIAEKRNIPFTELIEILDKEAKKQKIKELEEEVNTSELKIPITKSYVLDKEPDNKQSMITKIALDFKNDDIVACPYCGNMAEKNVMIDWLINEQSCPICKESLTISDCPIVLIRK